MKVVRIHPAKIAQLWGEIAPFIEDGLRFAGDDYTSDQVKVFLTQDQWMLIGVYNEKGLCGAISVAFSNMPNHRIAFITSMGGKLITTHDNLLQFMSILGTFGATKIRGCMRKSVARLLKKLDFKERYILVERDIP